MEIRDALEMFGGADGAAKRCQQHADRCRACSMPIIDPEGNPGLYGEACAAGLALLVDYLEMLGEDAAFVAKYRADHAGVAS